MSLKAEVMKFRFLFFFFKFNTHATPEC
jgi:hypothetical protein